MKMKSVFQKSPTSFQGDVGRFGHKETGKIIVIIKILENISQDFLVNFGEVIRKIHIVQFRARP